MPLMDGKLKKIDHRMKLMAELYYQGYQTGFALKDELEARHGIKISQPQISRDLTKLQKRWQETAIKEIGQAKVEMVAELNMVKAEMLQAWRDSVGKKVVVIEKVTTAGNVEVTTNTKEETGNSQYFEVYLKCVEKQIKIMGLDAPIKVRWQDNLPEGYEAVEVQEIFAKRMIIEQK